MQQQLSTATAWEEAAAACLAQALPAAAAACLAQALSAAATMLVQAAVAWLPVAVVLTGLLLLLPASPVLQIVWTS
jgi:hypothetical protein